MKTQYWLTFLFGLLFFLYFIPRSIIYSDYELVGWCIYGLIFIILPYAVYKLIDSFDDTTPWRMGIAALSVLIVGPTFGLYLDYGEIKELNNQDIWTKAIVINKKYVNTKSHNGWLIRCYFVLKEKKYKTHFENDNENTYFIGDTLQLIYSKEYPKIHRIGYQWLEK